MGFQYVDRIFCYEPGKSIQGIKNVTRNESFFYWLPDGRRILSSAVVGEALAQLCGWLHMMNSDFTKRGVLLTEEFTEYPGFVEAGDRVDLFTEVVSTDDDVIVSKGRAQVRGKDVVVGHCSRGYLLPMEELSDPRDMQRQFKNLFRPEFKNVKIIGADAMRLKPLAGGPRVYEALRFIDGLLDHQPFTKVVGYKNFTICEPYFQDHFPNRPIVPGVILLTCVGETCQYLIRERIEMPIRSRALVISFIRNVRFRKFVEPGDQCIFTAEIKEGSGRQDGDEVVISAQIHANDLRVMQAELGFRAMYASPKVLR